MQVLKTDFRRKLQLMFKPICYICANIQAFELCNLVAMKPIAVACDIWPSSTCTQLNCLYNDCKGFVSINLVYQDSGVISTNLCCVELN